MSTLIQAVRDLVIANRILAREGVVDGFGHVSIRHPDNPDRFLLSRSRSPELVSFDDILEFELDGTPVDPKGPTPYLERFIHGAIFEARPDVTSVIHNHAQELIPFSVTDTKLRPIAHSATCIGAEVPVWDIADKFGDTELLVVNMEHGRDLARTLADNPMVLMRGHGCAVAANAIQESVLVSIYAQVNARLLLQALPLGNVKYIQPGEIAKRDESDRLNTVRHTRTWEYYRRRAGCESL